METKITTILYKKDMKMSDLIDSDYNLLALVEHLNIPLAFGEKTIEAVCKENNIDIDCFIFLTNLHSNRDILNKGQFNKLPVEPFLIYLKKSHAIFLEYKLVNIRRKLSNVFEDKTNKVQVLMLDFFDKYYNEVLEHMSYENEVVFPYIRSLINEDVESTYSIDEFQERHNDIEGKVIDLKHLLMKYVDSPNQHLLHNILMDLYQAQDELAFHTMVEDKLVIPRVRQIEIDNKTKK